MVYEALLGLHSLSPFFSMTPPTATSATSAAAAAPLKLLLGSGGAGAEGTFLQGRLRLLHLSKAAQGGRLDPRNLRLCGWRCCRPARGCWGQKPKGTDHRQTKSVPCGRKGALLGSEECFREGKASSQRSGTSSDRSPTPSVWVLVYVSPYALGLI